MKLICQFSENHIVSDGLQDMVSAADIITNDSEKYVERLLELFRRYSDLVKDAFNNDPRFLTARDKAFKTVVNIRLSSSLNYHQRQLHARISPQLLRANVPNYWQTIAICCCVKLRSAND